MQAKTPLITLALLTLGACASGTQDGPQLAAAPLVINDAPKFKKLPAVPAAPLAADIYLAALNAGQPPERARDVAEVLSFGPLQVAGIARPAEPVSIAVETPDVVVAPVQMAAAEVSASPRPRPQLAAPVEAADLPPLTATYEVAALAMPMPAIYSDDLLSGIGGPEYSEEEFEQMTGMHPLSRPHRAGDVGPALAVTPRLRPHREDAPVTAPPPLRQLRDAL